MYSDYFIRCIILRSLLIWWWCLEDIFSLVSTSWLCTLSLPAVKIPNTVRLYYDNCNRPWICSWWDHRKWKLSYLLCKNLIFPNLVISAALEAWTPHPPKLNVTLLLWERRQKMPVVVSDTTMHRLNTTNLETFRPPFLVNLLTCTIRIRNTTRTIDSPPHLIFG